MVLVCGDVLHYWGQLLRNASTKRHASAHRRFGGDCCPRAVASDRARAFLDSRHLSRDSPGKRDIAIRTRTESRSQGLVSIARSCGMCRDISTPPSSITLSSCAYTSFRSSSASVSAAPCSEGDPHVISLITISQSLLFNPLAAHTSPKLP